MPMFPVETTEEHQCIDTKPSNFWSRLLINLSDEVKRTGSVSIEFLSNAHSRRRSFSQKTSSSGAGLSKAVNHSRANDLMKHTSHPGCKLIKHHDLQRIRVSLKRESQVNTALCLTWKNNYHITTRRTCSGRQSESGGLDF